MAIENLGKTVTLIAAASFASSQYCFASVNGSGQAAITGDGASAEGVIQDDVASGEASEIMVGAGITKLKVGAAVTAGDDIASDASGRGVTAGSGDYVMGKALQTATGANQYISILFQKRGSRNS